MARGVGAREVEVRGAITLGAFLKVAGAAPTGGQAKRLVQAGSVLVNGVPETRRGRQLADGDVVSAGGEEYRVCVSSR